MGLRPGGLRALVLDRRLAPLALAAATGGDPMVAAGPPSPAAEPATTPQGSPFASVPDVVRGLPV